MSNQEHTKVAKIDLSREIRRILSGGVKYYRILLTVPLITLPGFSGASERPQSELTNPEVITVTARLVDESIEEIPFTVNAISGYDAVTSRQNTLEDALQDTVGVDVVSNMGASKSVRMRGVGALQSVSGDDSSVIISIDGLPQSINNATLNIMDVEQIEVLKGPQGTLFGRNSEAGAINITTKKPTPYFEGSLRGEAGKEGQYLTEGMISGPFSDLLSGRLAVRYNEADTIVHNSNDGKPIGTLRDKMARGSLLWQAGDDTSVFFSGSHEESDGQDTMYVMRPYNGNNEIDIPIDSNQFDKKIDRFLLKLEHQMENAVFTATSGYSYSKLDASSPIYEGNLYDYLVGMRPDSHWAYSIKENLFNQELRLSSTEGADIFWVTGVNYFTSDRKRKTYDVYDPFYPTNPLNADIHRKFDTDNFAVFGEMTYPIFDDLRLTTGLRQSWEKKKYKATWQANPSNPSPIRYATDDQELSDNYLTGRVALSYTLADNTDVYGIYSRGYKTGGFNDEGTDFSMGVSDARYDAAKVNSYEAGIKAKNDEGSLGANLAYFYNDTKNEHLLAYNPITFVAIVENYDTRSQGVELDAFWQVSPNLRISAGGGYTHAEIVGSPEMNNAEVKSGNKVPDTPKWSASVSLSHSLPLGSFWGLSSPHLQTKITNRYIGTRPADPQNRIKLGAYNKLDARIGVSTANAEVYLWGDNLLDEKYDLWGYYMPAMFPGGPDATIGTPGRGRTFGAGFAYYF